MSHQPLNFEMNDFAPRVMEVINAIGHVAGIEGQKSIANGIHPVASMGITISAMSFLIVDGLRAIAKRNGVPFDHIACSRDLEQLLDKWQSRQLHLHIAKDN